jgi:hypothetical protein
MTDLAPFRPVGTDLADSAVLAGLRPPAAQKNLKNIKIELDNFASIPLLFASNNQRFSLGFSDITETGIANL